MTDLPTIRLENESLRVDVAPGVGGRIVSLMHKPSGHECLWRNKALPLRRVTPGTPYDPEFFGGIDEQIPCDGPETIDGIAYPDHGELWTRALDAERVGDSLVLRGELPLLGFLYERRMKLNSEASELQVTYRIKNGGDQARAFLWKLHAALAVAAGDRIICPASTVQPLDRAWSRCSSAGPFAWPLCGDVDMSRVPEADGTAEFLALTGLAAGMIGLRRAATGVELRMTFDRAVFPCCWLFASYGKLLGHHVVVLEPATDGTLTVGESSRRTRLDAGEELTTEICYALTSEE